jgi:outer membrane protein assembly factor BamB
MAGILAAATSQVWETTEYDQFVGGKIENLSVQPDGALAIAPALETVFSSDQPLIWTVAAAPDGSLFLGTGHQGNVYRIDPKGKSTLFWSAPEIEVFAIAVAPDGTVFAGTSPKGKVYRIKKKGEHEVYFDPEQTYIWSLAFAQTEGGDKTPDLFVGTGDEGKIYRVTGKGNGELYYESGQRHTVSLALDTQGRLLAGTDPNGILYRVEGKGKAFALHDSDMPTPTCRRSVISRSRSTESSMRQRLVAVIP